MKKIYHIYKTFYPNTYGGVETYIDSIISSKSKYNHILLSIGDLKYTKKNIIIFNKSFSYSSDFISLTLFKFILKNINKKKDLLHLHSPWPSMELFLLFFGYKNLIVTYHSDIIRQKVTNFFYKPLNKIFLEHCAKKIIVTSKKYLRTSRLLNKISKSKLKIIPIGISSNPMPSNLKVDNRKKQIIFIGSNRSYKGISLLIKIIKKIDQKFVCIGSNLDTLKKYNNVTVYHKISEVSKNKLLSDSGFLLMTSTSRNEAYGIVLVEALRSGLPLISPNIDSGVSWINKNNSTGYIFKTNDLNDVMRKIIKINNLNKKEYLNLKINARKRFEENFTLNTMIKDLNKLYEEVFHKN